MNPTVLAAVLLAIPMTLAGCIGTSDDVEPNAIAPIVADIVGDVVVHDAQGQVLAAGAFRGVLPSGIEFPVGLRAPEPTLGVTASGAIFYIAGTTVLRSRDAGATFEDVTPKLPTGQNNPPTTNDPYLYVDTRTDRVYVDHMYALTCSYLTWSDDEGETWTVYPTACGVPVNDHQTVAAGPPVTSPTVGYDNIVYYCWNAVAYNGCSKSLDGGHTFTATGTPGQLGVIPGASGIAGTPVCGGLHGHVNVADDGSVYIGKGACGVPYILKSHDEGVTWDQVPISEDVGTSTHDVDLAIDAAGTIYAVWRDTDYLVRMSHSMDQGASWTAPIVVSAPDVGSTFMPVVAAGDAGRVAVGYIGTTDDQGVPDGTGEDTKWYAFITVSLDADTDAPVFATTRGEADDMPVHVGPCIGRCGAFVDFIDIVIGPHGTPYMAAASCLDECKDAQDRSVGGGVLVTLATGPALREMAMDGGHKH